MKDAVLGESEVSGAVLLTLKVDVYGRPVSPDERNSFLLCFLGFHSHWQFLLLQVLL